VHGSGSAIGILAFGTTDPAIKEGRDMLSAQGIETDYMRLRALPLHADVQTFIEEHDRTYVIENNYDAQLTAVLRMEHPELATKLIPVAHLDGLPFTAEFVADTLAEKEGQA
jgi:2-oxoglutarate ferredoxin oxidoreductase subunit alpha